MNDTEYEKLLDEALKKVKPIESSEFSERFEIPRVQSQVEGKKTIITNFKALTNHIRRKGEHLAKYLMRELATPGILKGDRFTLQRRLPSDRIDEKIKNYVSEFVICKECGKPDTELNKKEGYWFIHCLACGAEHSVRSKI